MKKIRKEVWTVIGVCVVLTILVSVATISITGNVVNVGWWHPKEVYTKDEVDSMKQVIEKDCNDLINRATTNPASFDTGKYYNKSEVDGLINNVNSIQTIVSNNNTYTKAEVDSKINTISSTNTGSGGITKQSVLSMLNKCRPFWDALPIRNTHGVFNNYTFVDCNTACSDTSLFPPNSAPMTCIGAYALHFKTGGSFFDGTYAVSCDTKSASYVQSGINAEEMYAQCVCCSA